MDPTLAPQNKTTALAVHDHTIFYVILRASMESLWGIGMAFNISFLVAFGANFIKTNSPLRAPFFILVVATTVVRMFFYVVREIKYYVKPMPAWWSIVYEMTNGLTMEFHGIVILALALNRATALILPFKHKQVSRF